MALFSIGEKSKKNKVHKAKKKLGSWVNPTADQEAERVDESLPVEEALPSQETFAEEMGKGSSVAFETTGQGEQRECAKANRDAALGEFRGTAPVDLSSTPKVQDVRALGTEPSSQEGPSMSESSNDVFGTSPNDAAESDENEVPSACASEAEGEIAFGNPADPMSTPVVPAGGKATVGDMRACLTFRTGSHTARGPRSKNDDYAGIGASGRCFAISDGIGGAEFGDVMSRTAVNESLVSLEQGCDCAEALGRANQAAMKVKEWLGSPHSGATLLLAKQEGKTMRFAWVGDTVAFRLRRGALDLITEVGRVSAESNELDAAVGYEADLKPRETECDIAFGDVFLFCTDGVWEYLSSERIVELLTTSQNAPVAAISIVSESARSGKDNATALVLTAARSEESRDSEEELPDPTAIEPSGL